MGASSATGLPVDWSVTHGWQHTDHQGSVVPTADRTGYVTPFMNYSPWGELGSVDATQAYTAPPQGSPFGYTGREFDAETGLWQYRARYYSPRLGQFLSTDPIGMADDPNLYMYVGLDPVGRTDPTGMCPWCVGAGVGGGLELIVQLADPQTRRDYARAGAALARGDLGGAWEAGGRHVTSVAVASAAGAVGQVGSVRVAQGARALARGASTMRGAERTYAAATVGGNALVGAATGASQQVVRNATTGESGGVGLAAVGGAGGAAIGATSSLVTRGSAQLFADSSGRMVGTASGGTAAPGAKQGAREAAGGTIGTVVGRAYEEPFNRD